MPNTKFTLFRSENATRRRVLQSFVAMLADATVVNNAKGANTEPEIAATASSRVGGNSNVAYPGAMLPAGIRSRFVSNVNGLTMHILEAGFEESGRPCVLLLHGFPELAYSWRKQMLPLARAGYHVVAPDQRGYGLTTGWDSNYDGDV